MKRLLLVLGMLICMLGMTACQGESGTSQEANKLGITEDSAIQFAGQFLDTINSIVVNNLQEQYASDEVIQATLDNWSTGLEEIGEFQGITGYEVEIGQETVTIRAELKGSIRDASAEIQLDEEGMVSNITVNPRYTFVELMEKAALNTVLGMGTVFAVLILISMIIACFGLLFQTRKKEEKKAAPAETQPAAAPVEAVEQEELSDDLELVAVIAAAIAASQGAENTDGFVVRSIKRRSSGWQRA